jgi:hypothetical protein
VNKRPGSYPSEAFYQSIACPCVVAYDPFHTRINGGVDIPEAKTLAYGVRDGLAYDRGAYTGGTSHLFQEGALMSAVWGPNFDPTPRYHSGSK